MTQSKRAWDNVHVSPRCWSLVRPPFLGERGDALTPDQVRGKL